MILFCKEKNIPFNECMMNNICQEVHLSSSRFCRGNFGESVIFHYDCCIIIMAKSCI